MSQLRSQAKPASVPAFREWGRVAAAWLTTPRLATIGLATVLAAVMAARVFFGDAPAPHPGEARPVPTATAVPAGPRDPGRTWMAYQRALAESPEALDAMVFDQVRRDQGGGGMTLLAGLRQSP